MRSAACTALLLGGIALAQSSAPTVQPQTGVILRRPGEPLRGPVATPVPPRKPNLAPPILASFKGTILLRRESGIFVVRSGDESAQRVLKDVDSASLSPDSRQLAYFSQTQQLHLLALAANGGPTSDTVLEELPGARVDEIGWSPDGAILAYEVGAQTNSGVHVASLATHAVRRVSSDAGAISFSADGKHLLGINLGQGLIAYRLADGSSEVVYRSPLPLMWAARFSSAGSVGILVPVPHPPSEVSDDEPDCSGAQLQLDIVRPGGKPWTVPFPEGFDDVYDFDFSPDGRQVVVGFGTVGCDYPGDKGALYLVSLTDGGSRRLTPVGIALKGRFSPDGKQVAYTDFTSGSPSVFLLDLATGKAAPLIAPDEFGIDEVLDWR
jgi:WD40 repeat protein